MAGLWRGCYIKNLFTVSSFCSRSQQVRYCQGQTQQVSVIEEQPQKVRYSKGGFTSWHMRKDYGKRQTVKQYAKERLRINTIRKNTILPPELREVADEEIAALPVNGSLTRTHDRCCLTGRPRAIVPKYRLSRLMFRHFADYNLTSGMQRAMW